MVRTAGNWLVPSLSPSRASGYPLAPSQTRTCRFPASGSSGGRLAREHRLAPAFSARTRYPLLFGGRISMLCVILAFPINGSSFFRAPSQSFFFTVFFHMCFGFLPVCPLLGANTPSLPLLSNPFQISKGFPLLSAAQHAHFYCLPQTLPRA